MKERLKRAQMRQKSYADKRRHTLEFTVDDFVYLQVYKMKGAKQFGIWGKLSPRYVGLVKIVEKCGSVEYQLELLVQSSKVHNVFHILELKKCLKPPREDATVQTSLLLEWGCHRSTLAHHCSIEPPCHWWSPSWFSSQPPHSSSCPK
jgi:hypothetical protein